MILTRFASAQKILRENCSVVQDDESLRHLWEWLEYCYHVTDRDKYRVPFIGNVRFPGVRTVLKMDGSRTEPMKSEVIVNSSFDLSNNKKTYQLVVYFNCITKLNASN